MTREDEIFAEGTYAMQVASKLFHIQNEVEYDDQNH